jgi:hypothetical protein
MDPMFSGLDGATAWQPLRLAGPVTQITLTMPFSPTRLAVDSDTLLLAAIKAL